MSRSRSRAHPGFWAFLLHRLSGVALALFLPLHFAVLGLAIEGEARLDGFLRWTERPSVQAAEAVLVGLLALHLAGGLRLLALEFLPLGATARVADCARRRRIAGRGPGVPAGGDGRVRPLVERLRTDILILGAGGAGLFAALHAHKANPDLDITVAVKGLMGKSDCTRMVQGGYNVALAEGNSVERHFMDTIVGGGWLPRQDLAWKLVSVAPERVRELENEIGCFFDRQPGRQPARQGLRRTELRPHGAQG